jgi:hypothetical protein
MSSKLKAGTASSGAVIDADTTGILELQTGSTPTTAVTIDTSQNVGIGTSSPVDRLDVRGGAIRLGDDNVLGWGASGYNNYISGNSSTNSVKILTNNTERMRITSTGLLQFNSGYGSVATAYGCRAWVNFDGTGTPAIRNSGNVTSITDNGTGDYTVNFTTAMPDTNYTALATTGRAQGGSAIIAFGPEGAVPTTTAWRLSTISSGISATDAGIVYVAIFR